MWRGYHGRTRTAARWPNRIHSGINAHPFLGVTFALLIVFMIGTSTPYHSRGPDLPESRYAKPMPRAVRYDAQIVSVLRDGRIYYRSIEMREGELQERIRESTRNGADRKIYVRADIRAKYGDVKQVLGEIAKTGIENVCFFAEKVSP